MSNQNINLSISDLAYILGVTRATIYNWQESGRIPTGDGLDVAKKAIDTEEQRIAAMRARLSERVTERLIESI